ncbi:unnamed protein product [Meloidogyne enterolobii]|uniref:Uncharacterized protein n=1 Tax=Meloidogyne enterolobii TaxID=390850 RepID=A0ACB1B3B9_MELEN
MSQNYSIISIISLWVFISMPLFLEAEMFDGNFGAPRRIEESFLRDDENATKCKASLPCSDDKDCGEGGTCGGPTRKCQCRCFEKTLCKTPGLTQLANTLVNGKVKPCGGLKNACDEKTNKCECDKAYKEAGYEGTGDAFGKLCVAHSCKNVSKITSYYFNLWELIL